MSESFTFTPEEIENQLKGVARRQLVETIAIQTQQVDHLRAERDAWRAANLQSPEAQALSKCIVALDQLTTAQLSHVDASVERILDFLRSRYGIEHAPTLPVAFPPVLTGYVEHELRPGDMAVMDTSTGNITRSPHR